MMSHPNLKTIFDSSLYFLKKYHYNKIIFLCVRALKPHSDPQEHPLVTQCYRYWILVNCVILCVLFAPKRALPASIFPKIIGATKIKSSRKTKKKFIVLNTNSIYNKIVEWHFSYIFNFTYLLLNQQY
jgi:hypothetical protein